jgi:hypothetical protein
MTKNTVIFKNGISLQLKMSQDESIILNKAFVEQGVTPDPAVVNVECVFFTGKKLVHILIADISCILEG